MLIVNDRISIPPAEMDFSFSRSAGPGGQNVNKVNTKVTLHWPVAASASIPDDVRERFLQLYARRVNKEGQVVITSQRYRDQGRNVADCMDKLRELLLNAAVKPKQRKKTRRTRGSIERRLQSKREKSQKKQHRRAPSPRDL